MFEKCLTLLPRFTEATFINEVLLIALYFPWFSFAGTWIISIVFYDGELFLTNICINYLLFALLFGIAQLSHIATPVLRPCCSFFFDIYHFTLPSASFVSTLTYYALLVLHHRRRRYDWWYKRTKIATILITLVILGFPLAYMTSLWYYDVMHPVVLLLNTLIVALMVFGWTEITKRLAIYQQLAKTIAHYMHWKE